MYVFFFGGTDDRTSFLSNWYRADFSIGNTNYNCVEQYMMAQKAVWFGDYNALAQIMTTELPREQKAFGRKVKGFKVHVWNSISKNIVREGIQFKLGCNKRLMDKFLSFPLGTTFVEASPYDRIWGIGYSELNAMDNISDWGENRLGNIYTDLRNNFYKDIP